MTTYVLVLEYDGTDFYGWQMQPQQRIVQGELQQAQEEAPVCQAHDRPHTLPLLQQQRAHERQRLEHFDCLRDPVEVRRHAREVAELELAVAVVFLPTALRKYVGGATSVQAVGATLRQVIEASARTAESDLQNQRIPGSLRQVAEDYFDRIQGRTDD